MGWRVTIQCVLDTQTIYRIYDDLQMEWYKDPWRRVDKEWNQNMSNFVDYLDNWCKDSGIRSFAIGFTQIAVCATFIEGRDAMLFKLRWHYAS